MPPFEVGREVGPARALSAIDSRLARKPGGENAGKGPEQARARVEQAVVRTETVEAGPPPVDAERVSEIRKAIENGTYPVIPAKIADAMIAAGHMLRSAK